MPFPAPSDYSPWDDLTASNFSAVRIYDSVYSTYSGSPYFVMLNSHLSTVAFMVRNVFFEQDHPFNYHDHLGRCFLRPLRHN